MKCRSKTITYLRGKFQTENATRQSCILVCLRATTASKDRSIPLKSRGATPGGARQRSRGLVENVSALSRMESTQWGSSSTRDFRFIQLRCIAAKGAIRQTASVNGRGDERRGYRLCDLRSAPPRVSPLLAVSAFTWRIARWSSSASDSPVSSARERPLNFNSPKFEAARRCGARYATRNPDRRAISGRLGNRFWQRFLTSRAPDSRTGCRRIDLAVASRQAPPRRFVKKLLNRLRVCTPYAHVHASETCVLNARVTMEHWNNRSFIKINRSLQLCLCLNDNWY